MPEKLMAYKSGRKLEEADPWAVVPQHFLLCPARFTPGKLQVPPATIAAAPIQRTPRSQ